MFIAKIDNGSITVGDYRELFPSTSFPPSGPSEEFMQENGCVGVTVFKPYDRNTQKLVACDPYLEDGQVFTVRVDALTQEEIDAAAASKAAQLRTRRDAELARSDWRVIRAAETGVAMDASWVVYRQELRDITSQTDFPNIELPKAPDFVEMPKMI